MAVNKVVYGTNVLLDLTGDNVTADKVESGVLFHRADGVQDIGTATGGIGAAKIVEKTCTTDGSNSLSFTLDSDEVPKFVLISALTTDQYVTHTVWYEFWKDSIFVTNNGVGAETYSIGIADDWATVSCENSELHIEFNWEANVVFNGEYTATIVYNYPTDISNDTVTSDKMLYGTTAHNSSGEAVTGSIPVITPDAYFEETVGHKDATGLVVDNVSDDSDEQFIYLGIDRNSYYDGVDWIRYYAPDLLPENIVAGKTICGIEGTAQIGEGGGGLSYATELYSNDSESITYTSTSAGTAKTISNITDLSKYPFIIVIIENSDTSSGTLKFIRSATVIGNINFSSGSPSVARYGTQHYYTSSGALTNLSSTSYGLWGYSISASNALTIRGRCNGNYYTSLTGTYKVKVLGVNVTNASGGSSGGGSGGSGTSANIQTNKTVTPTKSVQTVTPDSGYDGLAQVTINAIPSSYIQPSGNKEITSNGANIDVTNYSTVSVNIPFITIYASHGNPSSLTGNVGDIFFDVEG